MYLKPGDRVHVRVSASSPATYTGKITKMGPADTDTFWMEVEEVDQKPKRPGTYPIPITMHVNDVLLRL